MSDRITIELETADVFAAFDGFATRANQYVDEAAEETADAIVAEAKARLQRQLGAYQTGKTLSGIEKRRPPEGPGWLVVSERVPDAAFSLHRSKRTGRTWTQKVTTDNIPLWLEKGTQRGKGTHANPARPYFYVSAMLEEGAHLRRVEEALTRGAAESGLGD